MFHSIVLGAVGASVLLASPSPSPTASAIPQIAHVVTSDRGTETAARSVRTTYVVTAADIARNGYRTVADALERVPGVDVERYGPFGAVTNVSMRGSSPLQVLVLLDGLPMAGAQTENVELEQIGVAGIDRIEVVEGGGSTLYGSGSIGGVINIITTGKAPSSATISTGSFGQQSYQVQTPYVSFQRTYAANDFGLPGGQSRSNSDAGLTAGTLTLRRTLGAFDLQFLADASQARLGTPGEFPFFISTTSRQNDENRDLRLRLERRSAHAILTLAAGISSQSLAYACDSPVDANCPNSYTTPSATATAPPYAELMADQHAMVELGNAVGDARQRLVYGIALSRGTDRIDGGTGSEIGRAHV